MPARFRLAFLGIDHPHGFAWRELLRHFHEELELVAIVPGFGGALASLEEGLSDVPRYPDVEQLLAGAEFDGAFVALPNDASPQAIAALARGGKHVLTEKPAAASGNDFREAARAVRESGVAFQCGYTWRYDPCAERLRAMVADGRFGKLINAEITMTTSDVRRRDPDHYLFDTERSGAGFFNWLGCHALDLLSYILQQPIVGVTARVGNFGTVRVPMEDGGAVIFDLADGSLVTFVGGYWLPRWAGESRWTIRGSERWVHWDASRPGTSGVLEIHGPMPQWFAMEDTWTAPPDSTRGYAGTRGMALVRDWLDAARGPRRDCRNTPESVLAALLLADTIYEASRAERRIACRIGG